MTRLLALVPLLLVACVTPQPPAPSPDLAPRTVVVPPPPPPPRPTSAEVEIAGNVIRPKGAKGEATVWATNAPCFQPGAIAYGQTKTNPDRWFMEIFVPQGTPIWL